MGSPDLLVGSQGVITVLPGPHPMAVIANTGQYPVYLDNNASCSPTSYDFRVLPGQTITWLKDLACYAITDAPFTSALSVSTGVSAYTSPPGISGGASSASDILYSGPLTRFPDLSKGDAGFNVAAYQSLRWRIYAVGPFTVANPRLAMYWGNKEQAPDYFALDSYAPNGAANCNVEVTQEVRSQFVWLNNPLLFYSASAASINLELTGYAARRSPLAFDVYDPNTQAELSQGRTLFYQVIGAGLTTQSFPLPLWSGLIDVDVLYTCNVAPTTVPTLSIRSQQSLTPQAGQGGGFAALASSTRNLRSVTNGIAGGRQAQGMQINAGAGYVSADININVTLHGSEDN